VVRLWAETLAALEQGVLAVAGKLDWAMRYALVRDRAARVGLSWEKAGVWTEVFDRLRMAAACVGYPACEGDSIEVLLGAKSPVRDALARATGRIRELGLNWDDGRVFLRQRKQFLEIDMRFGQLGEQGLFERLDRGGHLTHAVAGVDRVVEAMSTPPADTRASVRGDFVRRAMQHGGGPLVCGWDAIWNRRTGQVLDLSEPFERSERWRSMTDEEARGFSVKIEELSDAAFGA
jgi:hypothetical protein